MLAVIETHPIQYRAPVYRALANQLQVPLTVIYGSDFSVAGYQDQEFGRSFSWDVDLLSGYASKFLAKVNHGGARTFFEVSSQGLAQNLQEIKPQALLITGYNHRLYRAAFYQAWRLGLPVLFRAETTDTAIQRHFLRSLVRDMGLARFYRGCTQVLYIGENSKRHFQRFGLPESKMVFSPYCVDTQVFQLHEASRQVLRQQVRRDLNIADNQVVLIFSGKLSYRKGVDLILAAIQRLPLETQAKVVVLFLGSGELQPQLTHQAQAMVNTEVHFLGFQNQTALSPYYHGADLLILPSRYSETWGLVVNEALHHGLPCLVSDVVGCAPDLIKPGQTGNIFTAGSVDHLAGMLDQSLPLAHNPQVQAQCQQLVSHYSVDRAAAGIAQAYRLI